MKLMMRTLAFSFVGLLSSVNAYAIGTLRLTVVSGGITQELNLTETTGSYSGTLTTNSLSVAAFSTNNGTSYDIFLGSEYSHIDFNDVADDRTYSGFFGTRSFTITANAKPGDDRFVYDGTVGQYDDFTGKGDQKKLVLFWGKVKLTLEHGTTPGSCVGTMRSGGTIVATVSCETSGTSLDAFFTQRDVIVQLLVCMLVK